MEAHQANQADAELLVLYRQLLAKDHEMEKLIAQKDAEIRQVKASHGQEIQKLKTMNTSAGNVYHILEPALSLVRRGYNATCDLPLVGRFVKFGSSVADVGVKRMTPWQSCADLDKKIGVLVPYLDANVISPQINTYQAVAIALCGPACNNATEALDPYLVMARAYREQARIAVQPLVAALEPYVARALTVAKPLSLKGWAFVRPYVERIEKQAEVVVDELDKQAEGALDNVRPEELFERAKEGSEAALAFAKAHAGDVQDAVKLGAELVSDIAQSTASESDDRKIQVF